MPLPTNFVPTQLVITYGANVSVNINLTAFAVNSSVISAASFANDFVRNLVKQGYWNGLQYIPPNQIILITAS